MPTSRRSKLFAWLLVAALTACAADASARVGAAPADAQQRTRTALAYSGANAADLDAGTTSAHLAASARQLRYDTSALVPGHGIVPASGGAHRRVLQHPHVRRSRSLRSRHDRGPPRSTLS